MGKNHKLVAPIVLFHEECERIAIAAASDITQEVCDKLKLEHDQIKTSDKLQLMDAIKIEIGKYMERVVLSKREWMGR